MEISNCICLEKEFFKQTSEILREQSEHKYGSIKDYNLLRRVGHSVGRREEAQEAEVGKEALNWTAQIYVGLAVNRDPPKVFSNRRPLKFFF